MTNEEAKALLLNISAYDIDTQRGMKKQEAIEMAIKALEQEPCDKCVYSTSEGCQYDDITEAIPPFETSEDAVNRQAVNELQKYRYNCGCTAITCVSLNSINMLPPVTPQPKAGHWIEDAGTYYKAIHERGYEPDENTPIFLDDIACSECLAKFSVIDNETQRFECCPHCGAKMVEPQEGGDKE